MSSNSTSEQYGLTAQRYHWLSAILIISMIPLGFLMQNAESEATKMMLYRAHVIVGVLILLITIARALWRKKDINPDPPKELHGLHLKAFNAIHMLLYLFTFILAFSGIGTVVASGIADILSGNSVHQLPTDLSELGVRRAHGLSARLYIVLLIGHIGGVVFHQYTKSDVFSRMGINYFKTKDQTLGK